MLATVFIMGNQLRLNLRILMWHLQITPTWKFTWTYNDYHKGSKTWDGLKYMNKKLFVPLSHFDRDVAS